MVDVIFPAGMRMFKKSDKAPSWILGSLVITIPDFMGWIETDGLKYITEYRGADQIRLQIAVGKSGNLYVAVDTYKKGESKGEPEEGITPSQETKDRVANAKEQRANQTHDEEPDSGGLPF